jgi:hypothetical protein
LIALTAALLFCPRAAFAQLKFVAALNGAQEVPSNPSTGKGWCFATLNAAETTVTTNCTFSGLGSPTVAGHIHAQAVGVNGPIIIDLMPPTGVTSGSFTTPALPITLGQVASLKSNLLYINIHTGSFPGGEIRGQLKRTPTVSDFDGDGRTDATIYRQSTTLFWTLNSLNGAVKATPLGATVGESHLNLMAGEWDGDGIADPLLIRVTGGGFLWTILQSRTNTVRSEFWGGGAGMNDTLAPADYDGDGILDIAVFRRSTGVWYILQSTTGTMRAEAFGAVNDFPSIGDYDKDGKADLTAVRVESGVRMWYTLRSSNGTLMARPWGSSATDGVFFFAPFDVDGDGAQDTAINRTVSGQRMFIAQRSSDGQPVFFQPWGLSTDSPLFGDFDGDGKVDIVARRNESGALVWYILRSSDGGLTVIFWGAAGDQ